MIRNLKRKVLRHGVHLVVFAVGVSAGVFMYHRTYSSNVDATLESLDDSITRLSVINSMVSLDENTAARVVLVNHIAQILKERGKFTLSAAVATANAIADNYKHYKISPALQLALIEAESGFDGQVTSHAGARGLTQVMPLTGKMVVTMDGRTWDEGMLLDPAENVRVGIAYLDMLITDYKKRGNGIDAEHAALTAYNMGPTALNNRLYEGDKGQSVYSRKVLKLEQRYISKYGLF